MTVAAAISNPTGLLKLNSVLNKHKKDDDDPTMHSMNLEKIATRRKSEAATRPNALKGGSIG